MLFKFLDFKFLISTIGIDINFERKIGYLIICDFLVRKERYWVSVFI